MSRISNKGQHGDMVEVGNPGKIIRFQRVHRLKAAPLCHDIIGAVLQKSAEGYSDRIFA